MGFVMPRPLPPVPPTIFDMRRQQRHARRELEARRRAVARSEVARGERPYDWDHDGL